MFENGTFAVLGPDGKQVQCDVLFTYDCEDNGRSYVVFTTGEGAQQQLFANRYAAREDGQPALFPLENEQEYQIIRHCFEELKAKLAEQAAAQAARLTRVAPQVVVTGVTGIGGGRYIGCVGAARGGEGYAVKTPLQPRMFHGTGDIFAAVLVGRILRGNVPQAAVQAAAAFVAECIRQTPEGADERLGVWLENALPKLRQE